MNRKKNCAFALALLLTAALVAPASATTQGVTINVYNWGQYISDGTDGYIDVNAAFTAATGISVNYMTFDTNETLYTKLKTGGSAYDVIIPSDYMVARLIDEGFLLPLNFDNIPNARHIDEAYRNTSYDPDNLYSVPYTWGTTGVIYNTKYVDEADSGSWDLLWNEKYTGKILMFDNPRDAFAVAEQLLGLDVNTENEEELRLAANKLLEQKPLVQNYVMDQIYEKMQREEAWIAPYYAGDYLMMVEENEDLAFYFPEEGFNLFIDAMCIPTSSRNPDAAEAYINFLCDPEISGQNLEYLGYSVPQSAAKEYMDEELATDEIAYPDEETIKRGEGFRYLSVATNQLMDELWLTVKTDTEGNSTFLILVALGMILGCAAVLLLVRRIKKKKRHSRRGQA